MKQVVVIGADLSATEQQLKIAEEIGAGIAKRGAILVCGGRGGVMEAAARGAKAEGGTTVAILPSAEHTEANPFMDVTIPTGIGFARNAIVALSGEAIIVVGGGCGTMSEMGIAWAYNRPIVALTGVGGWSDKVAGTRLDEKEGRQPIEPAATAEEAVEKAFKLIKQNE
ncbi:MAG: TIGR00725 family protein [Candidatus Diapherotrites archaeon]|nr:TIGR00725 family protein [Candidatus Diapherotrites archaeon]